MSEVVFVSDLRVVSVIQCVNFEPFLNKSSMIWVNDIIHINDKNIPTEMNSKERSTIRKYHNGQRVSKNSYCVSKIDESIVLFMTCHMFKIGIGIFHLCTTAVYMVILPNNNQWHMVVLSTW